jgi:exodeoxyribonuclease V beta subunit
MESGLNLAGLSNVIYEFEFNLPINKKVNLTKEIATLLAKYYGDNHPYVEACKSLKTIDKGFLHGFVDLFFEYDNKYWILDYKTNSLNDYKSTLNAKDIGNPLVIVNASNHYYLQYLLYLVAIKRYLQVSLGIKNASNLIGGAIYYYVRGLFVDNVSQEGIYIDKKCQNLIDELDKLL